MENSLNSAVKELVDGSKLILTGELKIARTEIKDALRTAGRSGIALGISASLGILGAFSLLAFAIIGLGRLLDDNYWLSALLLGVIFAAGGVIIASVAVTRLRRHDFKMTRLADSIRHESQILNRGLHAVSGAVREEVDQLKGKIHGRSG